MKTQAAFFTFYELISYSAIFYLSKAF